MRVLTVQVDVTNLTDEQVDNLRLAMEAQSEVDFGDYAPILNSGVRDIDEESEEYSYDDFFDTEPSDDEDLH